MGRPQERDLAGVRPALDASDTRPTDDEVLDFNINIINEENHASAAAVPERLQEFLIQEVAAGFMQEVPRYTCFEGTLW